MKGDNKPSTSDSAYNLVVRGYGFSFEFEGDYLRECKRVWIEQQLQLSITYSLNFATQRLRPFFWIGSNHLRVP